MTFESAQLIDNIHIHFSSPGESPEKLRRLRVEKQLSMKELAEATGRTRSFLRQQLRKFGIQKENSPPRLGPFGWDWKDNDLVENAKEQTVICEILRLSSPSLRSHLPS
jgi:hypothetical protein